MRKLTALALLLCTVPLAGQVGQFYPGYGYQYFWLGFTYSMSGGSNDLMTTAGSNNGTSFTNTSGSQTGTPTRQNAPTPIYYNGAWYVHNAGTTSLGLSCHWYVGSMNTSTRVVTTIADIDWNSAVSSCYQVYAGEWFIDDDGSVHLTIPVAPTTGSGWEFQTYETHAVTTNGGSTPCSNNTPCTSLQYWSAAVSLGVPTTGYYDTSVFKVGSTYWAWINCQSGSACSGQCFTHGCGTGTNTTGLMSSTASSLATSAGTWTIIKTGPSNWAGWGTHVEGPYSYHNDTATGWRILLQDQTVYTTIPSMYRSDCDTADPTVCTWTAKTAWTEDNSYLHGTLRRLSLGPIVPGILGGS